MITFNNEENYIVVAINIWESKDHVEGVVRWHQIRNAALI